MDTITDSDLSGRVALVTGGSRGIGAATALRLAEAGADVAVGCGQHHEAAEEIAGKITGLGRRAVVVSGDMADPDVPRRIVAETAERLAPVDILVANAGTGVRADLDDVDVAAWDHVMAVNLRAPFLLAQAVVPHMREQRYGRIVLLSSVAAFLGGILSPQYTASKAGLIGLAHSLAATLAPHGVTVNAIAPGLIMTDMLAGDPRLETLERSVPVGRLGQPAEVADVIVAVARNAYMTGQTVSVDGGRYPR
ncbi:MAG TPA: SDR family NAD(P)-dependent oxidoreductase [Streptosporangiaceae bacterium]